MTHNRILYIGFYDIPLSQDNRYIQKSSTSKMDYIAQSLNKGGFFVHFISPAWILSSNHFFCIKKQSTKIIGDNKKITITPSISSKFRVANILNRFLSLLWLFFWLLFHTKKNERILVYHSPFYALLLKLINRIKKIKIILEVEEIYSEVWNVSGFTAKNEYMLLNQAECFIAVSDELAKRLGGKTKAVVYGDYNMAEKNYPIKVDPSQNINLIYAGSIDSIRGGAINSVLMASFLPDNYLVHICGSGLEQDIKELIKVINQINLSKGRCVCVYQGYKTGVDLLNFISICDIAINPQKTGEYMNSAFPSKIIFYLTNNLRVVSTDIKSIKESPFAQYIEFSVDDSPKSFAEAVQRVDIHGKFEIEILFKELDKKVVKSLVSIF